MSEYASITDRIPREVREAVREANGAYTAAATRRQFLRTTIERARRLGYPELQGAATGLLEAAEADVKAAERQYHAAQVARNREQRRLKRLSPTRG